MRRLSRTTPMVFLASLLAATLSLGVTAALAACGGGPCSCGSTVDTNTTLSALDPVCSTGAADTCIDNGLIINPGIILNLGGCTLRGAVGSADGVVAFAGAQVRSGRVVGFGIGVALTGDGGTASNLQISDTEGAGIQVSGNSTRVEKSIVRNAGQSTRGESAGVVVVGNDNVVSAVQALDNGGHGVKIQGHGNTVEKTNAFRNAAILGASGIIVEGTDNTVRTSNVQGNLTGIDVKGDNAVVANNTALHNGCGIVFEPSTTNGTLQQNQARYNRAGLCLFGSGHAVTRNVVSGNASDGIQVGVEVNATTGLVFERNSSKGNGGFGILDSTVGGGTSGTANTYIGNICSANREGASSPAGLCR